MATIANLVVNFMANANPYNKGVDAVIAKQRLFNREMATSGLSSLASWGKFAAAVHITKKALEGLNGATTAMSNGIVKIREGTLSVTQAAWDMWFSLPLFSQAGQFGKWMGSDMLDAMFGDLEKFKRKLQLEKEAREKEEWLEAHQELWDGRLKLEQAMGDSLNQVQRQAMNEDQRFHAEQMDQLKERKEQIDAWYSAMQKAAQEPGSAISKDAINNRRLQLINQSEGIYRQAIASHRAAKLAEQAEEHKAHWLEESERFMQQQIDSLDEAARLWDETRTEAERYAVELERISRIAKNSNLDLDTYMRSLDQLQRERMGDEGKPEHGGRPEFRTVDRSLIDIRGLTDMGNKTDRIVKLFERVDAKLDRFFSGVSATIS